MIPVICIIILPLNSRTRPDKNLDRQFWKLERVAYYFGGARSKGFARLRNVSKLTFFGKVGHAKSVGFWFYSGI